MAESTSTSVTPPVEHKARLSYEESLKLLMGLADFERSAHSPEHASFHLERMHLLMERLGNAHLDVPTIHIAGTKGKGSTAAMVTSMLASEGLKVGLFTSPHLHSAVERIRLGLEPVSRHDFAALVQQVWPAVEWVSRSGGYSGVTTFEMLTAMAFVHFSRVCADFQVMEVGLGGRLDSTNIVSPDVCAITSVSLDHVSTLGNTIAKIAYEKSGIIKPGVPVVVGPQHNGALEAIREVAAQREAPTVLVSGEMSWRRLHAGIDGQSFHVAGPRGEYDVWTPLLGDYQMENAATAIAIVETLRGQGVSISPESVEQGLRQVRWPARLEVVSDEGRTLVVDGAHNPYSMRRLVQAIREYFRFRRLILIFGALGGHSARGMIAELAELAPEVLAVRSRHPRSALSSVIADLVSEQGLPVVFESENVGEATRRAVGMASESDLILGTGSLSVAAEVIEEIRGIAPELYPEIKLPSAPVGAHTV